MPARTDPRTGVSRGVLALHARYRFECSREVSSSSVEMIQKVFCRAQQHQRVETERRDDLGTETVPAGGALARRLALIVQWIVRNVHPDLHQHIGWCCLGLTSVVAQ